MIISPVHNWRSSEVGMAEMAEMDQVALQEKKENLEREDKLEIVAHKERQVVVER